MKDRIEQLREQMKGQLDKLNSRTKKIIIVGATVLIIGAVVLAFILNNQPYETLFYDLSADEAQQIITKLEEYGVTEYKVEGDSKILVKESELETTKAKLVQEGYPKTGFTYDTYINNATMMTTDSDKQVYKLYELQDRIGSTIRVFAGVKDAKVTIALGEESKYALTSDAEEKSTATVVVTMKDGGSPTEEQAAAVQRLVAKSVPNMEMADVAVFDGNMNDVSVDEEGVSTGSDAEEIAQVVEDQIAKKVMKVLGPVYGEKNVRVSARAKINMEKLIRETTTYNTPEKIDENDKTGIVSKEDTSRENASNTDGAGGVAGAETNADTPQYNTDGNDTGVRQESESVSREYLVNQIKEQGQIDPGALDDLTVAVTINGTGLGSLGEADLKELIGNASGIAAADREEKISVASAPFYTEEAETEETAAEPMTKEEVMKYGLIAAGVLLGVIVLLIIILAIRKKKRKKEEEDMEEELILEEPVPDVNVMEEINKEIREIQNDRGIQLKKSVREFSEQNPEISAQLLKNWLNGGGENGE